MKKTVLAIILVVIPILMWSQDKFPDGSDIPQWFSDTSKIDVESLGKKYVITDYGVQRDSTLLQTEAIQKVIDLAAENGGGVVVIPEGTFLSASLFFKEGTHLHLCEGAVLKGIDAIKHYPLVKTRIEGQTRNYFAALVNADGLDGFTITGQGTIDGNGLRFWEEFWIRREFNPDCTNLEALRPRLVYISNCQNVTVQDVRLVNSPFWTNHLYKCHHVRYLDCYIFAPTTGVKAPSSDALDIDFCHDILVDGCYMSVNDDAVVLKGGKGTFADLDPDNGPNYNVIVQNCTYGKVHGCLTLGSESLHDWNVILRNCTFTDADRVLWLKMRPDTPQHYEYVRVENVSGTCTRFLVIRPWTQFYDLKEREDMPLSECNNIYIKGVTVTCDNFFDVGTSDKYVLRDFTFENCKVEDGGNNFDPTLIGGIIVDNLVINGSEVTIPSAEIVPKPVSVEETGGTVQLSRELTFNFGSPELKDLVRVWGETFSPIAGAGETKTKIRADVLLLIDEALEAEEYSLKIADAPNKVVISGGSAAGVWWGLQTFAQILVQSRSDSGFDAPCMSVSDKPFFAYRGGMLDCCRHFFTVEEVKKFIDILALHKLNVFHWHLTDDQGWRIDIKKYPRLTEVGSMRKETLVGRHRQSFEYDGIPHGGFYTQDEIRDIVKYAAERQITVIPEIEMPGHSLAALTSYPELGCVGKGYEVCTGWGVFPDIYCAGNDKTLQFLKDVLDEVCELFPSEYIHIGGDEAPTTRWEECPKCQAKKAELGLEKTEYLHGYMLRAIEEHLNAKGRKIIGWDEVLEADVTSTATIMSWRGPAGGIRAAKQGNHVIMSPNTHYYLDYYQTSDPEANGEPLGIGGYVPLSKPYAFDPFDELDEGQKKYITGVQANLWTEYIATFDHAQQMVLPRYCGLSEVAWGSEREDFTFFRRRVVDVMVPLYEALGLNYAKYGLDE